MALELDDRDMMVIYFLYFLQKRGHFRTFFLPKKFVFEKKFTKSVSMAVMVNYENIERFRGVIRTLPDIYNGDF